MKKLIALVLMVSILLCCSTETLSALPDTVVPLWDNIWTMNCILTFSGTEGHATANSRGQSGTTQMSGTLTVYKQTARGWSEIVSDSDTVSGDAIALSVDLTGDFNGYYKAVFEVTCTRNGVSESETKTSYDTCKG